MKFFGIQKTSLVDFPGRIATTLFTKGCNMRCSFCHNPELVYPRHYLPSHSEEEVLTFLESRKDKIEGVCITGGEPTLHKDLVDFIRKVKAIGLDVKLDTNGTNPQMVSQLLSEKLLDYVAMDVKACQLSYCDVSKVASKLYPKIEKTMKLLKESGIDFEFRTTVVRGIHDADSMKGIAALIKGAPRFFLQKCNQKDAPSAAVREHEDFTPAEMQGLKVEIEKYFDGAVEIR
jgi:pyruvate formate lyase activating enzyme